MSTEAQTILGSVLVAIIAAIVGLAVALSRTRERIARLEAMVERWKGGR